MTDGDEALSPAIARTAGALWFVSIIGGMFAQAFVRDRLIVSDNAAATAQNILASEQLYRLGIVADLTGVIAYAVVTLILYSLFRNVSRSLSVGQLAFGFAGSTILAANLVTLASPLILLAQFAPITGMPPSSLEELALKAVKLHSVGYNISIAFFSVQVFFIGCLILRSHTFPAVLGALFIIEGACNFVWVTAVLLNASATGVLYPYILLPGLFAEAGFAGWLLIVTGWVVRGKAVKA